MHVVLCKAFGTKKLDPSHLIHGHVSHTNFLSGTFVPPAYLIFYPSRTNTIESSIEARRVLIFSATVYSSCPLYDTLPFVVHCSGVSLKTDSLVTQPIVGRLF